MTCLRRQDASNGCHAGAQAALAVHLRASDQPLAGTGRFQGWVWHRGATRVAWRRRQPIVVYTSEATAGCQANENEHRYAAFLRERDKPWAPDTAL